MPIRGPRNPFPEKLKPQSDVFTTPQKMDAMPKNLKSERKVAAYALGQSGGRKNPAGGAGQQIKSPGKLHSYALRGPGSRKKV